MSEVLDLPALQARLKGKKSRLVRLAGVYTQYYPSQLQDIASALAQGDSQALYHSAHTLKGTLLSFEARPASALALQLETLAKEGRLEGAASLLEQLSAQAHLLHQHLQIILSDPQDLPQ